MKQRAQQKARVKRYTLTLSECEMRRLTQYAAAVDMDRPAALKRLVSKSLREVEVTAKEKTAANQLGLFDSLQVDIFNNTTKAQSQD